MPHVDFVSRLTSDGCHPPRLRASLRCLEHSLSAGDLDQAAYETRNSLEVLLQFFMAAAAGTVTSSQPGRLDIVALASARPRLSNHERLLRIVYPDLLQDSSNLANALCSVLSSNQLLERWLGLSPSIDMLQLPSPISSLSPKLQPLNRPKFASAPGEILGTYLELLDIWLAESQNLLCSYERVIEQGRWIGLKQVAKAENQLVFLPAFEWTESEPNSEPLLAFAPHELEQDSEILEEREQLSDLASDSVLENVCSDTAESSKNDTVQPPVFELLAPPILELPLQVEELTDDSHFAIPEVLRGILLPDDELALPLPDGLSWLNNEVQEQQSGQISLPSTLPPAVELPLPLTGLWLDNAADAAQASNQDSRLDPAASAWPTLPDIDPSDEWSSLTLPALELPIPTPGPSFESNLIDTATPQLDEMHDSLQQLSDSIDQAELKRISDRIFAIYNPKESAATAVKSDFRMETSSNVFETQLLPAVLTGLLGSSHGYLILEGCQGSGKSTLARLLVSNLNGKEILVGSWDNLAPADCKAFYFSIQHHLRGDFLTSIEILDERIAAAQPATGLKALGHWATRDLNVRHPGAWCKERMFAYLSGIRTVNQSKILLVLDGLDETFEGSESQFFFDDFLPERLPEGVYILLTCHRESCSTRLSHRLQSIISQGAQVFELSGKRADYRSWRRETSFSRFEHRLSPSMQNAASQDPAWLEHRAALNASFPNLNFLSLPDSELFPTALAAVFQRRGPKAVESVLSVASIVGGFTQQEMEELGLVNQALELVALDWPTLLARDQSFVQSGEIVDNLAVAHDMIRQAILENYPTAYSKVCGLLAKAATTWFMNHELEMDLALISQSLDAPEVAQQHRSQVRMTLRLYSWLLDSQDIQLQQESLANGSLRRARVQVCNELDSQGRFHEKLEILVYIKQILVPLIERQPTTGASGTPETTASLQDSFREELAWTRNSRALTYLRLGQFERSLSEVDEAISMFVYLIDERKCHQYRQGLAAALNRRSEALLALGEAKLAHQAAREAVDNFRWFVDQETQTECSPKSLASLALALYQKGNCILAMLLDAPDRLNANDPASGTVRDRTNLESNLGESIELYRRLDPVANPLASSQAKSHIHGRARLIHSSLQAFWARARYYLLDERFQEAEGDLDQALASLEVLVTTLQATATLSDDAGAILARGYEFDLARLETELLISKAVVLKQRDACYDALDICDRCAKLLVSQIQEGRLELRHPYAELLALRATIWSELRGEEQAQDDLEEAACILGQLIESEGSEQLYLQRSVVYQRRAYLFEQSEGTGLSQTGAILGDPSGSVSVFDTRGTVAGASIKPWELALAELDKASEDLLRYRAISRSDQIVRSAYHLPQYSVLQDPNNFELSNIYEKQGQLLASIRLFGRAADRYGEAITIYEQEQRSPLKLAKNLISRAGCYQQLQQTDLALEDYELAIQRVVPHLATSSECRKLLSEAHLQKARIWEQNGEHERAIREASRALNSEQADSDNKPELLLLRARLCLAGQLDSEADIDLEEALRLLSSRKRATDGASFDSSEGIVATEGTPLDQQSEAGSSVHSSIIEIADDSSTKLGQLVIDQDRLDADSSLEEGRSKSFLRSTGGQPTDSQKRSLSNNPNRENRALLVEAWRLYARSSWAKGSATALEYWENALTVAELSLQEVNEEVRDEIALELCGALAKAKSPEQAGERIFDQWGGRSLIRDGAAGSTSAASQFPQRVSQLAYEVSQSLLAVARQDLQSGEWRKVQQGTDLALRLMNLALRNKPGWHSIASFQLQAALLYSWNAHCCLELHTLHPSSALQSLARTSLKEAFRRLVRDCLDCNLDEDQKTRWQAQLIWVSLKLAELEESMKDAADPADILLDAEAAIRACGDMTDRSTLLKFQLRLLRTLFLTYKTRVVLTEQSEYNEMTLHLHRVATAIAESAPARQKLEALLVLDQVSSDQQPISSAIEQLGARDGQCLALADIAYFQYLVRFRTRRAWNQYLAARTATASTESQRSRAEFVDEFDFQLESMGSFNDELALFVSVIEATGDGLPASILTLNYFVYLASQPSRADGPSGADVVSNLERLQSSATNVVEQTVWSILLCWQLNSNLDEPLVHQDSASRLDQAWELLNDQEWSSQSALLDALAPLVRELLRRLELCCSLPRESICAFEADINQLARNGLRQNAPWLSRLNLPRQIFWNLRRW
jgi:tetratricopeptide (TPR) repeat protein